LSWLQNILTEVVTGLTPFPAELEPELVAGAFPVLAGRVPDVDAAGAEANVEVLVLALFPGIMLLPEVLETEPGLTLPPEPNRVVVDTVELVLVEGIVLLDTTPGEVEPLSPEPTEDEVLEVELDDCGTSLPEDCGWLIIVLPDAVVDAAVVL
jgi:hypothetical protein